MIQSFMLQNVMVKEIKTCYAAWEFTVTNLLSQGLLNQRSEFGLFHSEIHPYNVLKLHMCKHFTKENMMHVV